MRSMKVGIQFCGGCNPRIDRGHIARELQQALVSMGYIVVYNNLDADIMIFLSGCMTGCAFKFNPKDPPYVMVAATTVDSEDIGESHIVPEVVRRVRDISEQQKYGE